MSTVAGARPGESQRYMGYQGAAQYVQLSPRKLSQLVTEGVLRVARVGRRVLFDIHDLDDFLAGAKQKQSARLGGGTDET